MIQLLIARGDVCGIVTMPSDIRGWSHNFGYSMRFWCDTIVVLPKFEVHKNKKPYTLDELQDMYKAAPHMDACYVGERIAGYKVCGGGGYIGFQLDTGVK